MSNIITDDRNIYIDTNDSLETIKELCVKRLPEYLKIKDASEMIQVLTPVKKSMLGSIELNKALQAVLNPASPAKAEKSFAGRIYRVGDKVMQNKNDYMLPWKDVNTGLSGEGVFNGDLGFVCTIDKENGSVSVIFDDVKLVTYDYANIDEIETAFAMTVHKSQGSEFGVVVMPLAKFPPMLSTRNLFYTAVTRAKLGVVLVGDERVARAMVDNNFTNQRYSTLSERIKRAWGELST